MTLSSMWKMSMWEWFDLEGNRAGRLFERAVFPKAWKLYELGSMAGSAAVTEELTAILEAKAPWVLK